MNRLQKFKKHFSFQNALILALTFVLGVLLLAFVSVMVWDCAEKCISKLLGLCEKSEVLKFIGIGMGGILLALQALMSYKRAKALEDTAQHTEQGLRQERLKNAIEHLGHDKASVRLGGAYELFHLAKDIRELRQTVLDILCAHIRQTTSEKTYREAHKSKPSEEVQSLLTLLFVQEHEVEVFEDLRINFQESWLNGADLRKARLEEAVFIRAHLQEADLGEARLQGAHFYETQMQKTRFLWAQMQKAGFLGAQMQKTRFLGAQMQEASLWKAQMQEADFLGAQMQEANLREAQMQEANLREAQMQRARLFQTYLRGADLDSAQLQGADLRKAHLQGAHLAKAHLQGANLEEAHLQGVRCENPFPSHFFEDRIRVSIDKETDLSGVVFEGGLSQEDVDSFIEGLSDEKKKEELREILKPHIDKPPSYQLPENSGAITDPYTEEEAEQWIAEYKEAMKS